MSRIGKHRYLAVLLAFLLTVVLLGPIGGADAAVHDTADFSGSVDENGSRWQFFDLAVAEPGRITANLTWDDPSADLKLLMRPLAGSLAAVSSPKASQPRTVSQFGEAGTWRFMVRAESGASDFQINVDISTSAQPAAQVVEGTATAGGGSTTYPVTTTRDGRIDVDLIWTDDTADLNMVLRNSVGQTVAHAQRSAMPDTLTYVGPAGNYSVVVSAKTGSADFQLKMTTSSELRGTVDLDGGSKTAVFPFQANAGERHTFDLSWEGSNEVFLYLKEPSGATVASSRGAFNPKTVTHVAEQTGTYRVVAIDGTGGGPADIRIDHYDVPATAVAVETFSDVVTDASPRKIFTFDAAPGDRLTVDLDWAEVGSDLNVFIGRPGSGLVAWAAKDYKPETTSTIADIGGEWRIHVVSRDGDGTFTATVNIETLLGLSTSPPDPPDPPDPPVAGTDWPQFMRDNEHTGVGADTVITASNVSGLAPRWQANTGNKSFSSPGRWSTSAARAAISPPMTPRTANRYGATQPTRLCSRHPQ